MGDPATEPVVRSLVFGIIDPVAVGQVHGKQLPLHVTLVAPFTHPAKLAGVIDNAVQAVAARWCSVGAVGVGEAMFGQERDVRVQRLGDGELHLLHADLCAAVSAISAQVHLDETHAGSRYRPHVTEHHGRGLVTGAHVNIGAVALASKQSGSWINGQIFTLGTVQGSRI